VNGVIKMEITNLTFLTLGILLFVGIWGASWLIIALGKHDEIKYNSLNKPLKNKGKPWYNK
jgi:hypothetical protein